MLHRLRLLSATARYNPRSVRKFYFHISLYDLNNLFWSLLSGTGKLNLFCAISFLLPCRMQCPIEYQYGFLMSLLVCCIVFFISGLFG